jgi:protein-S-isoprenylcysteine O-methyltransferase Ste14
MFIVGWIIAVAGYAIRASAFRALGRMFTYQISIMANHKLITSGPYAWVRHPSYTGALANHLGVAICALSHGSWLRQCDVSVPVGLSYGAWAAYSIWMSSVFVRRTELEDEMLKQTFGKQWDEWEKDVRYRLLPGIY